MKSPWQIGLLVLMITGVSSYDIYFYKKYRDQRRIPISIQSDAPKESTAGAQPSGEEASYSDTTGQGNAGAIPPISREQLQLLAQNEFVENLHVPSDAGGTWPHRDPFGLPKSPGRPILNTPAVSPAGTASLPAQLPDPQLVFTGTLIEPNGRLALIDGMPRPVGTQFGPWQLARIEPDYILLQAGQGTRRIELKGVVFHSGQRKDPL